MSAALRREALRRAESMRSRRAAEVLRRALLEVRERTQWESSDGTIRGVDVRVLADGWALGLLEAPSVRDAVIEAITAVAPRVIGASVIDLAFEWALSEGSTADGYRGAAPARVDPRSSEDVRRALAAFLAATGDEEGARAVEAAALSVGEAGVRVSLPASRVEPALAILFGRPVRVRGA